jgi:GntR family transcriptional regulator
LPLTFTAIVCHITCVAHLRLQLRPGQPIFDQVVYAAKKAFISGEFEAGQPFPSVRTLAAEFKIHPNTAHKVVQHLIEEGFLIARPGLGTIVADLPAARPRDRKRLIREEVEQLVVEAKRVGLDLSDLVEAIETQWEALDQNREVTRR